MLRAGSIEIAGQNRAVYEGVLDCVEALSVWPGTTAFVYHVRPIYCSRDESLVDVSFETPTVKGIARPNSTSGDQGEALITLLEPLCTQSKSILEYAKRNPHAFTTDSNQRDLREISIRILAVSESLTANQKKIPPSMRPHEKQSSSVDLTSWHKEHCVGAIDDEDILTGFAFEDVATSAFGRTAHLGRMKRLITELSNLQSSLPDGIFVRHGSSRVDVMKVLIVGAAGTPYELGFFEFDLFCPPEYPKIAPMMKLLTTNGGTVRFNPNLYENGTGK